MAGGGFCCSRAERRLMAHEPPRRPYLFILTKQLNPFNRRLPTFPPKEYHRQYNVLLLCSEWEEVVPLPQATE